MKNERIAKIPEEIHSFISGEGGHSLLLKGETGTGKTTMALEMMEKFYGVSKTHYISVRVGEKKLFKEYPWLKKKMKKDEVIENARKLLNSFYSDEITDSVSMDEVEKTQMFLSRRFLDSIFGEEEGIRGVEREELQKLEGKVERGEIITEDDELDERLKNEFVFEIGKTLPELDRAYDLVDRSLPEKSLIVVDSIRALSEHYGIPEKKVVNALQKDLVEKSNTNVILLDESLEGSELDHMVDGVIELKYEMIKGRRIRKMDIKKLKTTEIKNSSYIYTLEGGGFSTIYKDSQVCMGKGGAKEEYPFALATDIRISTGEEELGDLKKNLRKNDIHLIEVDNRVPKTYLEALISSVIIDSCGRDKGTVVLPPFGASSDLIKDLVGNSLTDQEMEDLLLLQVGESTSEMNVRLMEGEYLHHDINREIIDESVSNPSEGCTIILGLDTLNMIYGENMFSDLSRVISSLKEAGHSVILLGPEDLEGSEMIKFTSDSIFHMDRIDHTSCIYGEKPPTAISALF